MHVSLDGGETWQDAPRGVRVKYDDRLIPGEDDRGALDVNCTHEGVILDVWAVDGWCDTYNIGTGSETVEEIIQRLIEENA
jgi:hypothetical protein